MTMTGGCYCGALRFEISGEIPMRALCLCQTCQKISGGAGNLFMGIEAALSATRMANPFATRVKVLATPPLVSFAESAVSRLPLAHLKLRAGLLSKLALWMTPHSGGPRMVFWTQEKQDFHLLPEGAAKFATLPGR